MTKIISLIFINLVTLIVGAKHELLFNEPATEAGLLNIKVELERNNNSVTKFVAMTVKNLVTPKAAARLELLLNKLTSGASLSRYRLFPRLAILSTFYKPNLTLKGPKSQLTPCMFT